MGTSVDSQEIDEAGTKPSLARHIMHHPSTAWIILLCSVGLTTLAWYISDHFVTARANDRFMFQITDIKQAILERMQEQERALRGGVGLFAASESVNRNEWKKYFDSLNPRRNYPGLQGFGFSLVVNPDEIKAHINKIRSEGFPQYKINPEGQRDTYTAIVYLEPFDWRNQRAFGYDMFSEPTRRAAMERARDLGDASVSGKVTLVQETEQDIQHGFLMYLPVYKRDVKIASVNDRRNALLGYVYSPFRIKDLMRGILGARDTDIDFEIFDSEELSPKALMYDSNDVFHLDNLEFRAEFTEHTYITIGGRTWSLFFNTKPGYISLAEASQPTIVAIGGGIIDILLFLVIASISRQHKRTSELLDLIRNDATEQAKHTQTITNTVGDGIITIDDSGVINFANPAVTRIFGYSSAELIGNNVNILMPEPDRSQHDQYIGAYQDTGTAKIIGVGREIKGLRRDGTIFPLELAVNSMDRNGKNYFVGILRDVTERHEYSRKLIESIEQMELRAHEMTLLSGLNDLLQTCQDLDEIYTVIQRALTNMFDDLSGALYIFTDKEAGLSLACQWNNADEHKLIDKKDCLGIRRGTPYLSTDAQPILKCQHFSDDEVPLSFCIPLTAQSSTIGLLTLFEKKQVNKDQITFTAERQELIVAVSKQISIALSNLRLRMTLEQQSIHDPLTGLHNRRFLQEMLPKEIQRSLRSKEPHLSILMIDIDHFKKINDSYGHDAGDQVLREFARTLKTFTRNEDLVVRYGGEEFILVLPTMDIQSAIDRANKIRTEIGRTRIQYQGLRIPPVTVSIGIACLPEHSNEEETLLRLADQALYAAKTGGRNCIIVSGYEDIDDDAVSS